MDDEGKKWRKLTFSQREGKAPLPEALQSGELNKKFKLKVWAVVETHISDCVYQPYAIFNVGEFIENDDGFFWKEFMLSYNVDVLRVTHDTINIKKTEEVKKWMKEIILKRDSHEALTLLEYMLRSPNIPEDLANNIESSFEFAPYFIDRLGGIATIIPSTSEEAKESIKKSLDNINQSELTGTKSHLRKATKELNAGNFSGSMRESIHAVASAAQQIDPKASNDLGPALDSLEKHGILKHPALKQAFKKLYGYTSDEQGIRKPLLEKENADVGSDEAIFMYGVCVAFVGYLASKQRRGDKK